MLPKIAMILIRNTTIQNLSVINNLLFKFATYFFNFFGSVGFIWKKIFFDLFLFSEGVKWWKCLKIETLKVKNILKRMSIFLNSY